MKRFKIKGTKGISYKNYVKEDYDIFVVSSVQGHQTASFGKYLFGGG